MVVSHELGCLEFAQDLFDIPADTVVVDLVGDELAIWVDDKASAQRQTLCFDIGPKCPGDIACGVGAHGIGDFFDSWRVVVPRFVNEGGVGADRDDLGTFFLESGVVVCGILELRRADEGKVCGVKEEDQPLAA